MEQNLRGVGLKYFQHLHSCQIDRRGIKGGSSSESVDFILEPVVRYRRYVLVTLLRVNLLHV